MFSCKINNKRVFGFHSARHIIEHIQDQPSNIVLSIGAEAIASEDEEFQYIINNSLGHADGIAAVYGLRQAGFSDAVKIAGCELWLNIVESMGQNGVYLLGASAETLNKVSDKLQRDFTDVNLLGQCDGFFQTKTIESVKTELLQLKPKVVVIAMGQPKQEKLAYQLHKFYPAIYVCVGGAFDVYAGTVKRAPDIFVKIGLEWLYRLLKQPTRWKRQAALPRVAYNLLFNKRYIRIK